MKLIPLTQGKFAQVDDEDFDDLNQYKWYAVKGKGFNPPYYARRRQFNGKGIEMHQQLLGLQIGELGDHKDGDGLNNQRFNIRKCTFMQNKMNQRAKSNRLSKYKGVGYRSSRKIWTANITHEGVHYYLGSSKSEEVAALLYNQKAIELFKEFARLNEVIK